MPKNRWTRQDVEERRADAVRELQECRDEGMPDDDQAVKNIQWHIGWYDRKLGKR